MIRIDWFQIQNTCIITTLNCRIAFIGDSFTEAGQVKFSDSFVGILQNHSDCIIKNYGVSSYSPIFYLLQWQKIIKKFSPDLVVVQLYSNDISSDKSYKEIAEFDKDGNVVAIPGPENDWITKQLRKSYLVRFLRKLQLMFLYVYENQIKEKNTLGMSVEQNPDISKISEELIIKLAEEVKQHSKFVLTAVPSKYRIMNNIIDNKNLQFSDKVKKIAQHNNIVFMDLSPSFYKQSRDGFKLFFEKDIHFNENGHLIFASELSNLYPSLFKHIDINLIK